MATSNSRMRYSLGFSTLEVLVWLSVFTFTVVAVACASFCFYAVKEGGPVQVVAHFLDERSRVHVRIERELVVRERDNRVRAVGGVCRLADGAHHRVDATLGGGDRTCLVEGNGVHAIKVEDGRYDGSHREREYRKPYQDFERRESVRVPHTIIIAA